MPLPLILAIPWLIDLAVVALGYIARKTLLAVAADFAWDYVKPRLLEWAAEYMPTLIVKWINYSLDVNLEWPVTPQSLTAAVNEKIGQQIFSDVTDRDAVRADCAKLAIARLNEAIPGLNLDLKDFSGTATAKKNMLRKSRIAMQRQARAGMESGASVLLPAPVIAEMMARLQQGYDWVPHVNKEGLKNEVGREMARWYARHMTRTWGARV